MVAPGCISRALSVDIVLRLGSGGAPTLNGPHGFLVSRSRCCGTPVAATRLPLDLDFIREHCPHLSPP